MKFPIALGDNVIVKPDPIENTTESGLIIHVDEKKSRPSTGTVYSVAEDCWLMKDARKKLSHPDRVMFIKNSGYEMEFDGDTYIVMESKHILAVF